MIGTRRRALFWTILICISCLIMSCATLKGGKDADISSIDRQILKIRQEIDRLYNRLAELFGRLNNHDRMISDLEGDMADEPAAPEQAAPPNADEKPADIPAADVSDIYAAALSAYEEKDYDVALQGFETVFTTAPDSDLADNAMYWAGECRYAQNAYRDALERFQLVLSRFPDGNKRPDALLKTGYCRLAMGEKAEARRILEEVIRAYPAHPAAAAARKKRARLG